MGSQASACSAQIVPHMCFQLSVYDILPPSCGEEDQNHLGGTAKVEQNGLGCRAVGQTIETFASGRSAEVEKGLARCSKLPPFARIELFEADVKGPMSTWTLW